MANVLEILAYPDLEILQELADDLEGALHIVAHTDTKLKSYLPSAQEDIAEAYSTFVERLGSSPGMFNLVEGIDDAIWHIFEAYVGFLDLRPNQSSREIAQELIYEHLILPEYYGETI